jgi:hypothetical protein
MFNRMMFKTVTRIAFICVIMALQGTITAKADVTIDPVYKDRIDIGPDKVFDWVQVDCVSHLAHYDVVVDDYCDKGPITYLWPSQDYSKWYILKAHSLWLFRPGQNVVDASLQCLSCQK